MGGDDGGSWGRAMEEMVVSGGMEEGKVGWRRRWEVGRMEEGKAAKGTY